MRLIKNPVYLIEEPYLTQTILRDVLYNAEFRDFDKDGYEISTPIEKLHYQMNGALIGDVQYHDACCQIWYRDGDNSESGLILDHTQILHRWAYAGEAREAIERAARIRPVLNKLLRIKPKWGIDFSIDYVTHEHCFEVFHIEQDALSYTEAQDLKGRAEELIDGADWEGGIEEILNRKSEWENLCSDDQSDWKARFWGWERAFNSKKVYF